MNWLEEFFQQTERQTYRFSNKDIVDSQPTLRAESIVFVSMLSSSSGPRSVLLGGIHEIHENHEKYENHEKHEKHENHEKYEYHEKHENIEYMEKVGILKIRRVK